MKNKSKLFLWIGFLSLTISVYFFVITPLLTTSDKNLENEIAETVISSQNLIKAYQINEEKSNKLYAGRIIEVTGTIKEITYLNDRNTIILESSINQFGVICDVHPAQNEKIKNLKKHQKIKVKGICKGFLKDVIMLNCTIDLLNNE